MDPRETSSSMIHRASSGVRPRRSASAIPNPQLIRQHCNLVESCIRPICADPDDDVEGDDDIPKPDDSVPPSLRHTLPGIHVDTPDLLGLDLSRHPSAFLYANEVRNFFVYLLRCLL